MDRVAVDSSRSVRTQVYFLIDDLLCEPSISARERSVLLRLRSELEKRADAGMTVVRRTRHIDA